MAAAKNLSGLTVLLADDVSTSRSAVLWLLKDLGSPEVFQVADGKEALRILAIGVDFIISDFNMPELHGLQLLKAVRTGQHNIARATPFTLLTGYSDKNLVDVALALDVNAFLVKPVSKRAFTARIGQVLEQSENAHWLKSANDYASTNVESILKTVTGEADSKVAKPTMPAKQPLMRNAPKKKSAGALHGEPTGKYPNERLVSIETLPWNAVLTRDIYTPNGQLFMKAGADLTPRVIALMTDLDRLNSPVKDIWVTVRED